MAEDLRRTLDLEDDGGEIRRGETGVRILLTLLFVVIAAALEAVLGVLVVFSLLWALITQKAPDTRVRELANRVIAYYYRIGRYLTYNEPEAPFPFDDFPEVIEGDGWQDEAERLP